MFSRRLFPCLVLALAACGKPDNSVRPVAPDSGTPLPRAVCLDNDGDGFNGTGDCANEQMVDCNDGDPMTFPGALELCDGLDQNCNGQIDEGLPVVSYYLDADGDGVGSTKSGEGCKAPPSGSVTQSGDCDDTTASVRPGQAEVCNDVDDDCDGTKDNGLPFQDFFVDQDGDGYGNPSSTPTHSCQTQVSGRVSNPADCNDADPTVKPGAVELCNKIDDNCDAQVDNGIAFVSYYPDVDGDGFGDASAQAESSCAPIGGKVLNNSDCNDASATVKPNAPEVCNASDDDCDGQVDEGLTFTNYYPDQDGDGFGAQGVAPQNSCLPVAGKVTSNTDCNDMLASVKPGAPEVCNGADDNCAGGIDDGLTFSNYYVDADGDGVGTGSALSACAPVTGRVTATGDCNDSNPAIKPGAPETCNGLDDNCVGGADEGLTFVTYYPDADGDSFGATTGGTSSCTPIAGRVTNNTDCNDALSSVNPSRSEVCNQVDDNCNGQTDEGLATQAYYVDVDSDGYGALGSMAVNSCGAVSGRVTNNTDCDDSRATVHPNAPELCNGADDNCDSLIDNGVTTQNYYIDSDRDGYGAAGSLPTASCSPVANSVTNNLDCNDMNAAVKPGATEVCNLIDDNCNAQTDEGLTYLTYYPDVDGDTYGAATGSPQSSCAPVMNKVTNNGDCNDANINVHPGVAEICNGQDDDCTGGIDNGLPTQSYYVDGDGDGFGNAAGSAVVNCGPVSGRVPNNSDCNDGSSAIRPTATEICNGIDDNCSGAADEGNPGGGGACSTGQSGVCAAGTLTCVSATVTCVRNTAPSTERCNGLDDDCNGSADETFSGLGTSCSVGQGVCLRSGTNVCNGAQTAVVCSASAGSPTAAACDGLDNDCDGITDEPVLTATTNVTTTAWQDIEVRPYYYSAGSCAGGANGSGTDALAGGALLMGVGSSGINIQPLNTVGQPTGASTQVTSLTYSDVDFAQSGDGFLVAGVWAYNNSEIDLYYTDSVGAQRTFKYTQFVGATNQRLDSLHVVRGNGRRAVVIWREAGTGIKMSQIESCNVSGTWEIRAAGCASTTLTSTLISPSTTAIQGVGADSNFVEWTATQTCQSTATQRRVGISYLTTATSLNFFRVNENGTSKETEIVAYTVASPRTLAEPDVTFFRDGAAADQFFVAYVTNDPGATTPQSDLNFWLTNDQTWHYAYLAYATDNGASSIARPRTSATATQISMSAVRWVADASGFKKQVMTRNTDLTGSRTPLGSAVELSVTSGSCLADPACRPGDKAAFTNWAPFSMLYYSGSGSTPTGSFGSTLSCN
ncbi:MAG: putative metal-binding motif-containing protein [Myxococcaceae bacterium]